MEAKAQARFVRVTPQKARRVIDLVRGHRAPEAINTLKFATQAPSLPIRKVVESAVANLKVKAEQAGATFNENDIVISEAYIDEGPTLKRFHPRAQGRAGQILKRSSHITIVVSQIEKEGAR